MTQRGDRNDLVMEPSGDGGGVVPVVIAAPVGRQTVWWVLTVVVAMVGTMWVMRQDDVALLRSAAAQRTEGIIGVGGRGIYAFTGQLTSKTFGLFMMDVDTGTVWCYEMDHGINGQLQMKLVAARSWIYDRYLEEFNVADPVPGTIRDLITEQRSHRESGTPGESVNPPPGGGSSEQ